MSTAATRKSIKAVTEETWDFMLSLWHENGEGLQWETVFALPPWLKAWWDSFRPGEIPNILAVRDRETLAGIAPLIIEGNRASTIWSSDLTDYTGFITAPGRKEDFFRILLPGLKERGIDYMDTGRLREDSCSVPALVRTARGLGYGLTSRHEGNIYELELPGTWEEYMGMLTSKERHEINRKMRRLEREGDITYQTLTDPEGVTGSMDVFLRLFRLNTPEKAMFMDTAMEGFFRRLAGALSEAGLLRLSFLKVNGVPAAATFCFDYASSLYLYNNGYDRIYRPVSAGILSKVFSIREGILAGRKRYDFLKGDEPYKQKIGGTPVRLFNYRIRLVS